MPRKKSRSEVVVLHRNAPATHERVALPLSERRLSFGDRWSYAPAPEANDYIKLQKRYPLFIGGKIVAPQTGENFYSINPAAGEKLAGSAGGKTRDGDIAGQAARKN